jgi:HNH endonuclease
MGRPKGSWTREANPRWNGGAYTTEQGYVFVFAPDHANADKRGYVREHALVMSEALGRPIAADEVVHHINGIRHDNRLSNLQVMKRSAHHSHHQKGLLKPNSLANLHGHTSEEMQRIWDTTRAHERSAPKICEHCGKEFYRKGNRKDTPNHAHTYCSRACYGAHFSSGAVGRKKAAPYAMHPNSLSNLRQQPKKPLKVCNHCGAQFYRRGTPKGEHVYCSVDCAIAHRFTVQC